ncbi:hypothetical protein [Curtobacterium sp. MCSS17_006]|uniref:hypothetical protein n=1 Tax=Curtobacterium sp. MCSS17_006 TaxID=2175642 RepID=UPI0011B3A412|nr:hypothetical protein [Curtobacterium sp. MCSS17_006]
MKSAIDRAVGEARTAGALPERLEDVDAQTRRKVEVEARWHRMTPERYYREALTARNAANSLDETTDDVLAEIRGLR